MDKTSKKDLANDIENRLDDFFGDEGENPPEQSQPNALEKLKTVILSIDWEITDSCLDDLDTEIDALLPQWQHNRLVHALLRMIKALGHYIRSLKAQAHPDAIKRAMSAFKSLETLVDNDQMDEEEQRKILAKEIAAFKQLKQQVEASRGGPAADQPDGRDGTANFVDQKKFEQAVNDVEKRLGKQVELLKSQLKKVQEEIDALRNS